MSDLSGLLAVLDLEPAGDGRFHAKSLDEGGGVVFGGQLLAQTVVAGGRAQPGKDVRSVQMLFARSASPTQALDIQVESMHEGGTFGSVTVSISQGDRLCTRALVLLDACDPDLIRHAHPMPAVSQPADSSPTHARRGWELGAVGGVDISDPDAVGPPELHVWSRFTDAPDDPSVSRALLAYATDGFLIGTAMRPHPGFGQRLAHVSISTTVIAHNLTFHEPFRASEWLLLSHASPYAGCGRSHGSAHVYTTDGRLVASFSQDNMIRAFAEGRAPAAGERARH